MKVQSEKWKKEMKASHQTMDNEYLFLKNKVEEYEKYTQGLQQCIKGLQDEII